MLSKKNPTLDSGFENTKGKKSRVDETSFEMYAQWLTLSLEEKKDIYNINGKVLVIKGTDLEFAAISGRNRETLSRWKTHPELWERRDKYLLEYKKHTGAVIRGLIRNCIAKGNGQDVKAYMEIVEGKKYDGRMTPAKIAADMVEDAEEGTLTVNRDGSVDLTMRLRKYEDKPSAEGDDLV
jgi:hypothetical protein